MPLQSKGTVLRFGQGNHFANIDARLGKGASISGTVRAGSKSGPLLSGACVVVNPLGGTMPEGLEVSTGPNGKYLIPGLGTGRYSVVFAPGCGNKGSFSLGKSTSVSVTDGKVTRGIDGFLPKAGEFSGTVTTGPQHRPVPGICVEALGISGHREVGVDGRTSSTGRYAFADLPAGHYQVGFFAGCGSKGSFAPQFYKGQENAAAADSFLVRPGARVGGINAVMRPGGIVTGMVTDTAGRKLTGVCVVLANQAVPGPIISISIGVSVGGGAAPASASSSPVSGSLPFLAFGVTTDGHYRITDLQPGNYSVTYSTGCKRHQPTESTAWFSPEGNDARSLLTVGTATTTGVDAKLSAPGTITGMITGPAGQPVAGVCAVSVGLSGEPDKSLASLENFADTPKSNREGRYQITGLAAGRYGIQFFPCTNSKPVAIEWYRHSAGFAGLTPVVVRSGQVTAGIDGHLVTGQSISGRITVAGSRGPVFQRACIRVTDPSGNFVAGFGESKKDGTYLVPNLAPGTYNLQVGPCGGDALSTVLRTHVKVGASSPTTRVDVALPAPGLIAGRVTGGSRARAVGGSCVIATPEMGHGTAQTAFSASDGRYSLGGLAPGKYRIEFTTDCEESSGGFASQWFDHQATSAKSTPVVVRSGKVTAGIDARLAADGTISGLVKVSGKPRAGVCVLAFRKAGGTMPTIGVTDARGSYLIGGLRPGRYVVEFTGGCGVRSYRTQWFDGASSRKGATPVAVRAGSKATGINAH